jgi:glycosyltransferase involved in cell wall biosynthesis
MNSNPVSVSIVMAVYNRVCDVAGAIDSVREQTWPNLELVVVDGASTDGTAELLRARSSDIDHLVIEADDGIYDAWNKGLELATGEWILFLGSDDRYVSPESIEQLMAGLELAPDDVNLLTGRCRLVDAEGTPGPIIGGAWNARRMEMWMTFAHPSSATHRDLLEQHDRFSLDVGIAADYDFYLRARRDVRAFDTRALTTLFSAAGTSNANRIATLRSTRVAQARDLDIGPRRARWQYLGFHVALPFRTAVRRMRTRRPTETT